MSKRPLRRARLTAPRMALIGAGAFGTLAAVLVIAAVLLRGAGISELTSGFGGTLAFTLVGIVILWRRPGHRIGRLTLAIGLMFAASAAISASIDLFNPRWGIATVLRAVGSHVSESLTVVALVGSMILVVVWFPDGRRGSRLGAVVEALLGLVLVGAVVGAAFTDWTDAPLARDQVRPWFVEAFTALGTGALVLAFPLAIVDIGLRYGRADALRRTQIRWVLAASATSAGLLAALVVLGEQIPGLWDLFFASTILPAIAITIAITRYHLYDIDRIISRTIGYGAVTVILIAVLGVSIVGLQALLAPVTDGDAVAVAGSTLVVAAMFNPLRTRIQSRVDRRFNRARYDTDRTIEEFSGRLRDELDLATLTGELERTTMKAVEPASSAVWIRSGAGR